MIDPVSTSGFILGAVAVASTGYAYFRSSAVKVWEQNTAAYRERVEVLEKMNTNLLVKIETLEARVHELEARPDWTAVVRVVGASEANIIKEIRQMLHTVVHEHEERDANIAAALATRREET